ncbi:alpha-mannosidase At3g26720-like isoform X1 [Zingiber officinale]|uniref:alpha-mannosidase At3g26720-like isoform X1 n=1 Tax=Zingiber officinale TaxID=94328 RepID=UPI001C4B4FDA|nr:alpha-mannosidase At3g26720-like isoform X1 [Zingiber officinale]
MAVAVAASLLPFFYHLLVLSASRWLYAGAAYIAYNTSGSLVPGKINVHLVPHSHDDVGWLKTIDQYYVGSNNSIQGACIQNVLDSVVEALLKDKNRKFIYVEMAFFHRWWRQQSDTTKKSVKGLVSSGQLEFINGGWCMHDEAAVHYIDMIDQTTLGHQFLKQEFGQVPRIAWQIDPFGHSAVQAYLLGAEVGFDALYFSRIDYQDRQKRTDTKSLEVVWRGSKTLGSSVDIFTGIFPKDYEPPPGGFYFEVNDESPVIQDDPLLFDYNVQERVDDFVAAALSQANITRTNHIMFTMGTDFKYQYASSWFRQMDKFIHYVNKDARINALYSTPSIYTDAKHAANEAWPLKMDDFFPYADRANAYWTGYFTSRPALKAYVRMLSSYYLAARQLEFLKRGSYGLTTNSLAEALAIAQHHDAITGTEKQHVADDYAKRLAIGYTEAAKLVESTLTSLTESHSSSGHDGGDAVTTKFEQCSLLNISYCPASESEIKDGRSLVVLVYNSLGWRREDIIRIPVISDAILVTDHEGKIIKSQLLPINSASLSLRKTYVQAYIGNSPSVTPKYWLAFPVTVEALGFSTYFIRSSETRGTHAFMSIVDSSQGMKNSTKEVEQGNLKLQFNHDGKLSFYFNKRSLVKTSIEQTYSYYVGNNGSEIDPQASGAYVFRPSGKFPIESDKVPLTILEGPLLHEVHQQINSWIHQITRLHKTNEHVEVEFIIGPIPSNDGIGKEVVTQFTTTMDTRKTFYTDSNGRDFIKRIRDHRSDWNLQVNQPVSGNYYPINLGMYIEDEETELSVLVDRAVGGTSLVDGQVELMLHRRLFHDDSRGVAENLDEEICIDTKCEGIIIQGKLYIRVDPLGKGAQWRRSTGQKIYSPLLIAFSEEHGGNWSNSHATTFSMMDHSYSLPDNVALITLQELQDGNVLIRFAHMYEADEDKNLSEMAYVDLKKIFPDKKISKIVEMNLSANQERQQMEKKKLKWQVESSPSADTVVRGGLVDFTELVIELGPMEIRTFILNFNNT